MPNNTDDNSISTRTALIYGGIPSVSLALLRGFFTYIGIKKNQHNGFNEDFYQRAQFPLATRKLLLSF